MAYIKLETSQNVLIDYATANTGERIFAYLIDIAILGLYFYSIYLLFGGFSIFSFLKNPTLAELWANLFIFFPIFFYDLVFEVFNKGRTPGKMLLKMQVIKLNGEPASFSDYSIRWLMRPIDIYGVFLFFIVSQSILPEFLHSLFSALSFFSFGLIAILSISLNNSGQRVGDFLAGTTLVKVRKGFSLKDTILLKTKSDYVPTYLNALKLSDKDVRLIKETIEYYTKTSDSKYIIQLAEKAKDFLEIETNEAPIKFLVKLMKDYNHLALEENGRI